MGIKSTLWGGCALLGLMLVSKPAQAAEPIQVKPLVYTTTANAITAEANQPATIEQVGWRGRGWGGGGRGWGGGWGGRGWGGRSGFSVGIGYGGGYGGGYYGRGYGGYYGGGGYYGRGYHPGYYAAYSRPYYGYGNYYPRHYGYNYSYYSPSYVSVGIGGPGYSAYYGGYPYYGTFGYGGTPYYAAYGCY